MGTNLSLAAALGAMSLLEKGSLNGDLSAFNIHESQYKVLTQDGPWIAGDRAMVTATLEAMMFGLMDQIGVQRFNPPAEYIAAVLATFVKPVNMWLACRYMEGPRSAEDMATGRVRESEPIRAEHLFAFIVLIEGGSQTAKANFEKQAGFEIDRSVESEPENEVRKKAKA